MKKSDLFWLQSTILFCAVCIVTNYPPAIIMFIYILLAVFSENKERK